MKSLDGYRNIYSCIKLDRTEGVLVMRLHQDGKALLWNDAIHSELVDAFYNIAHDPENRIVILTGTGDDFCAGPNPGSFQFDGSVPPVGLDHIYREGKAILFNQMSVPCPMIAAVNGKAHAHPELVLLCDIVVASRTASFRDPHLHYGIVPGDGIHIVFPLVFGMNRGRYLALTSKEVTAKDALQWGAVAELVEPDALLPRALQLASELAKKPVLGLRYTREAMTREIMRQMQEHLGYGLILEGFASGYGSWGSTLHARK
jgi:enoyl-CoA hydratase/carnithine racemase